MNGNNSTGSSLTRHTVSLYETLLFRKSCEFQLTIHRNGDMIFDQNFENWASFETITHRFQLWRWPRAQQPCMLAFCSESDKHLFLPFSVQKDIVESLRMDRTQLLSIIHPFNRGNLFYETKYHSPMDQAEHMSDVHQIIANMYKRRGRPSSGIIYCRSRKTCDELSDFLRRKGISSRPYHRGLKCVYRPVNHPRASSFTSLYRRKELDKTMQEWQSGGNGEGGIDVVSRQWRCLVV